MLVSMMVSSRYLHHLYMLVSFIRHCNPSHFRDQFMSDEFQKEVEKCTNLTELRNIASQKNGIFSVVEDSLSPV